jgi:hypothetical protein
MRLMHRDDSHWGLTVERAQRQYTGGGMLAEAPSVVSGKDDVLRREHRSRVANHAVCWPKPPA